MKRIIIASALALVCLGASAQTVDNTATRTKKPRSAKIAKKKPVRLERTKRDVFKLDERKELKLNDTKICKEEPAVIADSSKIKKRRITPKKPIRSTK